MRRALLTTAVVLAGALAVPAAASPPQQQQQHQLHYRDSAQTGRATRAVAGTLTPIASEAAGHEDGYGVVRADGTIVPVSLDLATPLSGPRPFTGRVVAGVASNPVVSATIGAEPTRQSAVASPHRLYVAVITNRGALDDEATVDAQVTAMRTYWQTESAGYITSFTQPTATVRYSSAAAPATSSGCGLGNPSPVWNEAAARFPGVDFGAAGNHLMVLVSADCAGPYGAGVGTVGASLRSGGYSIVSLGDGGVQIGAHELGHNLSLQHANAQRCAASCTTEDYWGLYSVMGMAITGGGWTPPALDTAYRVQEGIAPSAEVPTVTSSATVHLGGRGTSGGVLGLVATDPSSGARFVVDYRSGTGRDATAFYAQPRSIGGYTYRPGVVVERVEADGSTTVMTTASGSSWVTSFTTGQTFTSGGLSVRVDSASPSAGADVTVLLPGSTPPPAPAFASVVPTILGTPQVGRPLAVVTGAWTPAPAAFTYAWTANGTTITGATGASFTPTAAQRGRRIGVRVTGTRTGYPSASRVSVLTAAVATGRLTAQTPTITGRAITGRVLTARPGTWRPSPRLTYRWYAAGRVVGTGVRLTVTRSLRGQRISVLVTGTRPGYATATRTSARTAAVR